MGRFIELFMARAFCVSLGLVAGGGLLSYILRGISGEFGGKNVHLCHPVSNFTFFAFTSHIRASCEFLKLLLLYSNLSVMERGGGVVGFDKDATIHYTTWICLEKGYLELE